MGDKNKPKRGKKPPAEKRPVGRPKTVLDDLPGNWKQIALDLYREGATDVEIRCALPTPDSEVMSIDLWNALIDREPEFSETVSKGRALAETWHQQQARAGMWGGKQFNAGVFGLIMKNRFGWSEKQETKSDQKISGNLTVCTGIDFPPNSPPDDAAE